MTVAKLFIFESVTKSANAHFGPPALMAHCTDLSRQETL